MKGVLCLAEVKSSQSENSKVLTSEQHLLSTDSINAIRFTKYVIGVTGSGHAHKIPITPSFAVYIKCVEVEKQEKRRICNRRLRK